MVADVISRAAFRNIRRIRLILFMFVKVSPMLCAVKDLKELV